MKEDILRSMIRKQIKSSLKEADVRTPVAGALGRVEKMAAVKMLKRALGTGSDQQQAAGLLKVIQVISGNDQNVANILSRMLRKKDGLSAPEEPTDTPPVTEAVPASLKSRSVRVDKTQAMKMMKQTLDTKPATQQADFVLDLLKGLNLKSSAKQRLFQRMRRELGKGTE